MKAYVTSRETTYHPCGRKGAQVKGWHYYLRVVDSNGVVVYRDDVRGHAARLAASGSNLVSAVRTIDRTGQRVSLRPWDDVVDEASEDE